MASTRGIEFRAVPTSGLVHSDPALIKRILRNLLDNAVKFTETGRILLGCRRRGHEMAIQVWDTGIGIPADKVGQIFEEFYQLGNPGRDRHRGLGLGLSIVDRLARVLGHPVRVFSVEGRGSMFEIRLPLSRHQPVNLPEPSLPVPTKPLGWRGTVMIIDNDQLVLTGLKAIFEAWDCLAITATDREAAWAALSRCPEPSLGLILADYRLASVETGLEVIARFRERLGWPVPGVIMTGGTLENLTELCREQGFELIQKPITAERLRDLLK